MTYSYHKPKIGVLRYWLFCLETRHTDINSPPRVGAICIQVNISLIVVLNRGYLRYIYVLVTVTLFRSFVSFLGDIGVIMTSQHHREYIKWKCLSAIVRTGALSMRISKRLNRADVVITVHLHFT